MSYRKSEWKKSYRKIPDFIITKLKSINSDNIRVETVKSIPIIEIRKNKFKHIGIYYDGTELVFAKQIIPDKNNGHASNYNQKTKIIVRKDLEKISKTYSHDSPNFGDWSKGSHEVERIMKVYQKLYLEPLYLSILIEKINESDREIGFKFSIGRLISKSSKYFDFDLLRDINLLQENCGNSDIYDPSTESHEYLNDLQLNWEILPPGTQEDIIKFYFGRSSYTPQEKKEITDRYDIISRLKPICYIKGSSGMQRYFGAKFSNILVAFENLKYGNAIYIMKENWEKLSKLSRIELMKYHNGDVIRIIHRDGWSRQFEYIINKFR
jgi:hypothetical protein